MYGYTNQIKGRKLVTGFSNNPESRNVRFLVLITHIQTHYRAFLRWSVIVGEDQNAGVTGCVQISRPDVRF